VSSKSDNATLRLLFASGSPLTTPVIAPLLVGLLALGVALALVALWARRRSTTGP